MTTHLYQNLLLVQHIPAIEGIAGVQDLIKAFAYTGDLYREKARQYKKRLFSVLQKIDEIKTLHSKTYKFLLSFDVHYLSCFYSAKYLNRRFLFQSNFCPVCGDYKTTFVKKRKNTRLTYPRCNCENRFIVAGANSSPLVVVPC